MVRSEGKNSGIRKRRRSMRKTRNETNEINYK
jgi:hypothetical protein